jgi:hypothetical protein
LCSVKISSVITIATFWKTEEAHLFRLRLGVSGIESFLQDETTTQMHPWRAAALGGVRVQVHDEDVAAVEKLLAAGNLPSVEMLQQNKDGELECFACNAPIPPGQTRCASCGWSYED